MTEGWSACQDQQGCHAWIFLGYTAHAKLLLHSDATTHPANITAQAKRVGEGRGNDGSCVVCMAQLIQKGLGWTVMFRMDPEDTTAAVGARSITQSSREREDNLGLHAGKLAEHAQNTREKGWGRSSQPVLGEMAETISNYPKALYHLQE